MEEIYLDNSATTRTSDEAAHLACEIMTKDYGNPSSMHMKGVEAERYLKEAKATFAGILKCSEKEIYFTSGGTESDNMSIIGAARANARRGKHIITSSVEHPAVSRCMEMLEGEGFEVTYLPVDETGTVSVTELKEALREDTILVSIMYVNNEVGSVMPIGEMGAAIKEFNKDIVFHVDAVQAFGKYRINPYKENIDLLSVSSHKIHGPKGVGMLFVKDKTRIKSTVYGGGQQGGFRSGTENVPGIAAMALAAKMMYESFDEDINRLYELKEYFTGEVMKLPGTHINGPLGRKGAPHIISVSFDDIARSEVLLHSLEERGIYVSSGSACASNHPGLSGTLTAMGIPKNLVGATIRFSMSVHTTHEELEKTLSALSDILPVLRRYKPR